jgi:diaminopimelate decarboxylase
VDEVRACGSVELVGFHIYAGTQCLSADTLVENFESMIDSFRNARDLFGIEPRALVFGAGFGIPYYDDSVPIDLPLLADHLRSLLTRARRDHFPGARFLLELGRFLVGEAGVFATSVIDVKPSRGRQMVICDGGMNHHLGAAGHLGTILPRNYRMFRVPANLDIDVAPDVEAPTQSDIVGPLCTSIDTLGRKVELGQVEPGDLIGIECSGAYGASVSPRSFISHPPPKEVFVESHGSGEWTAQEVDDVPPTFPAHRKVGA